MSGERGGRALPCGTANSSPSRCQECGLGGWKVTASCRKPADALAVPHACCRRPPPLTLSRPLTCRRLFNKVDSGPVPLKDPVRLDCSAVAEGGEHELWLLQLPVDVSGVLPSQQCSTPERARSASLCRLCQQRCLHPHRPPSPPLHAALRSAPARSSTPAGRWSGRCGGTRLMASAAAAR